MRSPHALAGLLVALAACGGTTEPPPPKAPEPPAPAPIAEAQREAPPPPHAAPAPAAEAPPPREAPAPPREAPAGKPDGDAAGVPSANLTVSAMEVDGVVVETLSCKVDGLGLLGAVVVAGTLAKQRGALAACGVKAPVPVGWTLRGGRVTDATAGSGDARRDACIVRALKHIQSTNDGVCRARVGVK